MTAKVPEQPYIYEGLDEQPFRRENQESLFEQAKAGLAYIRSTFAAAQQPGMPLSVISNVTREAPLASLLAAFLLGVAVARRR